MAMLAAASSPGWAASVNLHPNGRLVVFEGQIERGDLARVEAIARSAAPTGIYLASPGGDLAEAMKIGLLVRARAWETRSAEAENVPAALRNGVATSYGIRDLRNNLCTSACFFIFVAGIHRDGHAIGIHQPCMAPKDLERLSREEAERASLGAHEAVVRYLQRMGVPARYVDEMYAVPREGMRWLSEAEIDTDFHGFIPEVREWVGAQCGADAGTARCKEEIMTGIRIRALEQPAER
jgi:hypothetical protein